MKEEESAIRAGKRNGTYEDGTSTCTCRVTNVIPTGEQPEACRHQGSPASVQQVQRSRPSSDHVFQPDPARAVRAFIRDLQRERESESGPWDKIFLYRITPP